MEAKQHVLDPIAFWCVSHLRAFLFGLGEMIRAPFASFLTLIVIGIAMALPAGFYVMLNNFQKINHQWQGKPSISLYLKQEITQPQLQILIQQLKNNMAVANVNYISPEQGLQQLANESHLNDLTSELNENPLPGVLVVTPSLANRSPSAINALLFTLQKIPEVDISKLDTAWIKRLYYIINIGERLTFALAILFGIGVIVIIGNTIRLTLQSHYQEILVMKLVGATYSFIRRPLLYRGILYGFIGGVIAWMLIAVMALWLESPIQLLAQTYNSALQIHPISFLMGFTIIIICSLLGWIGSWFAVNRYLYS